MPGDTVVLTVGEVSKVINVDNYVSAASGYWMSGVTAISPNQILTYDATSTLRADDLAVEEITIGNTRLTEKDLQRLLKEHKKQTTTEIKEIHIYHEKENSMSLTSLGGIVLVIVICLITVKFIAPRTTLRNAVRWFWHLIWKPGRKAKAEVSSEWEKVQREDK